MRWFVPLTVAMMVALSSMAAHALTQEEILKRRLDKMQRVDSQLRTEEQQREEQLRESTTGFGSGPSKQGKETLAIPAPVRQPHPEPKGGLFNQKAAATKESRPSAPSPSPVASQPAVMTPPPPAAPRPITPPANQPVQAAASAQPAGRDPKTAASLAAMAAKAQASGDNQTALTMLDEAIAADPADPDLRNNRGNILSNLGKPKEALGDYDRAIAAKSSDPTFFTNRGLAHDRLGNRDRACTDY